MAEYGLTGLLTADSPLDEAARRVVESVARPDDENGRKRRHAHEPLGAEMRRRVAITGEEMYQQPEKIEETLREERKAVGELAALLAKQDLNRMFIVGCGDSWYSALGVRMLFEELLGIPCEPMQALDFAYYYYKLADKHTLVISLSSSGTVPRTTEAMFMSQAQGAHSVVISNSPGSPMVKNAPHSLIVHAKREGWPTQASTALMAMMSQLGIDMARLQGGSASALDKLEKELYGTPAQVAAVLKNEDAKMLRVAEREVASHIYLFAGGGPAYSSAMFGAAKIKELTPDYAFALPQEEYHHFDSLKAGDPIFVVAPEGRSVPRAKQTAEFGKLALGHVYGVVSSGGSPLLPYLDEAFELPVMDERLVPIVYTVPLHMFAYHVSVAKFKKAGKW